MKKLLLLVCVFAFYLPALAQDDVITKYFGEYEGRDDFTTIYITNRMFGLIAQIPESEDEEDLMNVIRKLTGLKIITSSASDARIQLYRKAKDLLPEKGFEELMIIKEGKESINFLIDEKEGMINEFVMLIGGDDSFFLMSMMGSLTLDDISRLSKTMDIDEFEHLQKIKE